MSRMAGEIPGRTVRGASRSRRLTLAAVLLVLSAAAVGTAAWFWNRAGAMPLPSFEGITADPDVAAAVAVASDKVKKSPRSAAAWGRLAQVLLANDLYAQAMPCLVEAERLDPREPRWPYLQAVLLQWKDSDGAIAKLRRAAELCGEEPRVVRLRLAELLLQQGSSAEAEDLFRAVLARDPDDPRALLGLGRSAYERGDLDAGLGFLQRAARSGLAAKPAHACMARIYTRTGNHVAAERETALAEDGEAVEWPDPFVAGAEDYKAGKAAVLNRVEHLVSERHGAEAIRLLEQALDADPSWAEGWLALGKTLIDFREARSAAQALARASRLNPTSASAHYYQGVALFVAEEYPPAAASFARAIELKPDHATAYFNLGHCLEHQGMNAEAVEAYRAAVRFKPQLAEAYFNLGSLLDRLGRRDEALANLRRAVRLRPANRQWLNVLARVESGKTAATRAEPEGLSR